MERYTKPNACEFNACSTFPSPWQISGTRSVEVTNLVNTLHSTTHSTPLQPAAVNSYDQLTATNWKPEHLDPAKPYYAIPPVGDQPNPTPLPLAVCQWSWTILHYTTPAPAINIGQIPDIPG